MRGTSAALKALFQRMWWFGPLIAIAAFVACSDDGSTSGRVGNGERRDSAGVIIVTYGLADLERAQRIQADTAALFRVGAIDGPPGTVLNRVRSVIGRTDGSFVVADDRGTVVRLYDGSGGYIASQGRQGQGPGEYGRIDGLALLPGDSVAVFDRRNSRMSVLDRELQLAGSAELPPGIPPPSGAFGSWSTTAIHGLGSRQAVMLAAKPFVMGVITKPGSQAYVEQDTLAVLLLKPENGSFTADTVTVVPGGKRVMHPQANGVISSGLTFTASPSLAGNATGFAVADGSVFEIRRFNSEGNLTVIIRVEIEARRVTGEDRAQAEARFEDRRRATPAGAPDPMPPAFEDHHPLIRGMELDAAGNTWVMADEIVEMGRGWIVFGMGGEVRAWSQTLVPSGSIRYVGADYVLVVDTDSLQVQRILKYALPRLP